MLYLHKAILADCCSRDDYGQYNSSSGSFGAYSQIRGYVLPPIALGDFVQIDEIHHRRSRDKVVETLDKNGPDSASSQYGWKTHLSESALTMETSVSN